MGLPLSRPRLHASWAVLSVTSSTVTESGGLGGPGTVRRRGEEGGDSPVRRSHTHSKKIYIPILVSGEEAKPFQNQDQN